MKDKQKRKKERTWAEAARMVLENFSDAPMTPKQILHVIQTKGLKEMRSERDRVKNSIFFKLPGRMSLYHPEEKRSAVDQKPVGVGGASGGHGRRRRASVHQRQQRRRPCVRVGRRSRDSDRSGRAGELRLHRDHGHGQRRQRRKKAVMMPRVVLTPLKVNGEHVPSGPMKRNRGGLDVDFETPGSILVNTNIRALINVRTFSAFPPQSQQQLLQLLPEVDRQVGAPPPPAHHRRPGGESRAHLPECPSQMGPDGMARLSSSALNNEFFTHASQSWKERLAEGRAARRSGPAACWRWSDRFLPLGSLQASSRTRCRCDFARRWRRRRRWRRGRRSFLRSTTGRTTCPALSPRSRRGGRRSPRPSPRRGRGWTTVSPFVPQLTVSVQRSRSRQQRSPRCRRSGSNCPGSNLPGSKVTPPTRSVPASCRRGRGRGGRGRGAPAPWRTSKPAPSKPGPSARPLLLLRPLETGPRRQGSGCGLLLGFGAQGVDVTHTLACQNKDQVPDKDAGLGGVIQHSSQHVDPPEVIAGQPPPARLEKDQDGGAHSDSTETASDCENEGPEAPWTRTGDPRGAARWSSAAGGAEAAAGHPAPPVWPPGPQRHPALLPPPAGAPGPPGGQRAGQDGARRRVPAPPAGPGSLQAEPKARRGGGPARAVSTVEANNPLVTPAAAGQPAPGEAVREAPQGGGGRRRPQLHGQRVRGGQRRLLPGRGGRRAAAPPPPGGGGGAQVLVPPQGHDHVPGLRRLLPRRLHRALQTVCVLSGGQIVGAGLGLWAGPALYHTTDLDLLLLQFSF
ncbi:unnamed protein product [Tetraodon nigroviridis]|uniref:(spotted green pufferfish) hypothetical protein n=1 Tax=Tetraodon nigroviridis TaxID=99883 RepID=Q4T4D2_TETNG|nr:unnamed protein product [Tetraodon nigroviridis]